MIPSLIITFRETLEAALVVGIVLSFLSRTRQQQYRTVVYVGVFAGIVGSLLGAVLFTALAGGFTGRAEESFEGVTMLVGALLLTTMILWMLRQRHIAKELESKVAAEVAQANRFGLFSLVFFAVLREGIETVIFLGAASAASTSNSVLGALAGIAGAVLLGYAMFVGSRKIDIKTFFRVTSVLLILFAAGLVAQGVHELQEAHVIPTVIEHVWDINPPVNADGSYPGLHENGYFGGLLKSLFGYNGNPSLVEILSYFTYLATVVVASRKSRSSMRVSIQPSEV
jgi:high-affinity iron transporter